MCFVRITIHAHVLNGYHSIIPTYNERRNAMQQKLIPTPEAVLKNRWTDQVVIQIKATCQQVVELYYGWFYKMIYK